MNKKIEAGKVSKLLILISIAISMLYMSWWFRISNADNVVLYTLLLLGEVYHVGLALMFFYNVWPKRVVRTSAKKGYYPSVCIFITVAGEPVDIVAKTIAAAKNINYPNFKVYVLNDGFVAKSANWRQIEELAFALGVHCITRKKAGGAKAGNINNGLRKTTSDLVVIFDADMVPNPHFLVKTVPYFADRRVGFVQTPQYYKNNGVNDITESAWKQQEFFFGPIMQGKEKSNASFICGTNVVIRRKALVEAGGMVEDNIAEDFLTSLFMHQNGWKSYYLNQVLAHGLAPEDLMSYYKQQLRWARGSLEVMFKHNPFFKRGLTFAQRIEYMSSALYYFGGLIVVIDAVMPLLFLSFGLQPVQAGTTVFALYFLPFIFFVLFVMYQASSGRFTLSALSFSFSSWEIQLRALFSVILGQKMGFSVTPKKGQSGRFVNLLYPHFAYITLFVLSAAIGIMREGVSAAVTTNLAWGLFNIILFLPFIAAGLKRPGFIGNTKPSGVGQ